MSDYEKGYADGFNARKVIPIVKMEHKGTLYFYCGHCNKLLGRYKAHDYTFCPFCGVRVR